MLYRNNPYRPRPFPPEAGSMTMPPFPPFYEVNPYVQQQMTPYQTDFLQNTAFYGGSENWQQPFPPAGKRPMDHILGAYKTKEGYYDVDKIVQTFGQVMNTFNSAAPVMKQFGSLFLK